MKITVTLELDIDHKNIEYMEGALFDHNYIGYWGTAHRRKDGFITIEEHGGLYDDDDEKPVKHHLPKDWIAQGIKYLAERRGEYGPYRRIHELLEGDCDAESLDVLVQAALFKGEIRYG